MSRSISLFLRDFGRRTAAYPFRNCAGDSHLDASRNSPAPGLRRHCPLPERRHGGAQTLSRLAGTTTARKSSSCLQDYGIMKLPVGNIRGINQITETPSRERSFLSSTAIVRIAALTAGSGMQKSRGQSPIPIIVHGDGYDCHENIVMFPAGFQCGGKHVLDRRLKGEKAGRQIVRVGSFVRRGRIDGWLQFLVPFIDAARAEMAVISPDRRIASAPC